MLSRFKNLVKFDQRRLDAALLRIRGKRYLIVVFNVFLLSVNSLGYIKRLLKTILSKIGLVKSPSYFASIAKAPENMPAQLYLNDAKDLKLRVLIVCETSISQCLRYRVEQKLEQLLNIGQHAKWLDWTEYFDVRNAINFHHVIVFYRVPGYPASITNIEYAKALNKVVIYDVDDLIFDKQELQDYYQNHGAQYTKKQYEAVLNGASLYKHAILQCDFATTTTPILKEAIEKVFREKFTESDIQRVFIHPNGIDSISHQADNLIAQKSLSTIENNEIVLFYGSGSNTHDNDFEMIADDLANILCEHSNVKLMLVGQLSLPKQLERFSKQIYRYPLLPVEQYFTLLKRADINLAPLVAGLFADCKSEIKWIEAALLGIPSIVSNTDIYKRVIAQAKNGMIVGERLGENSTDTSALTWYKAIELLISDNHLRQNIATQAKSDIRSKYSLEKLGLNYLTQIKSMIKTNEHMGMAKIQSSTQKKRLVFVNVLYPPQAMGGATIVVRNLVENIVKRYSDKYDVYVFTSDIENLYSYQVKSYHYNDVNVTALSVPKGSDIDIRYQDDNVKEIFDEYCEYIKPDVIHFHSIQHLTASMVQTAVEKSIPYYVTVHDAWWLSQFQFLINSQSNLVNLSQSDPMVALQDIGDFDHEYLLKRAQYLLNLLNKANAVLAVSNYQKSLYESNGINHVILNENGVDLAPLSSETITWPDIENVEDKLILGYTGSVCHHKGYYFVKKCIQELSLNDEGALANLVIIVIDFNAQQITKEKWAGVEVFHIPKLQDHQMTEFYDKIDVLLAPSIWPESFGIISRESVLSGTWALVSKSGGLHEIIEEGVNGLSFEMGDQQGLYKQLLYLHENVDIFQQKPNSLNANNIINVNTHTDNLLDIFEQNNHHNIIENI